LKPRTWKLISVNLLQDQFNIGFCAKFPFQVPGNQETSKNPWKPGPIFASDVFADGPAYIANIDPYGSTDKSTDE